MKTYLKIKIASLAAEAKLIKREERKWKSAPRKTLHPHPLFFGLQSHRLFEVRTECRSAHLAYGYLRGRAYSQIEGKCYTKPNWARVEALVSKYGNLNAEKRKEVPERIKAWAKGESYSPPSMIGKIKAAVGL